MSPVPQFLLDAIDNRFTVGSSFRLIHEVKNDGSACSVDKDPCLVVTRYKDCWKWYCHRCGEHGIIFESNMSPTEVAKRLDKTVAVVRHREAVKQIALPRCRPMWEQHAEIPYEAYHWLWSIGLTYKDMERFTIMWSPDYQRVIFPIYDYDNDVTLIGWVGREVYCPGKEERKVKKVAKYITQKQKNSDRLYFRCEGAKEYIVIVEDALSAIKLNKEVGVTTIALLTTHIDDDLIQDVKAANVYVWLDPDMNRKAVRYSNRMNSLGVKTKAVLTAKDPKYYEQKEMMEFLVGYEG